MTMADRSASSQQSDDKTSPDDHIDLSCVPRLRSSAARTSSRGRGDRDRRACNLDLSSSPSLRPGSATRDSGYNTDVSPAATTSPATNTAPQQHFVFDHISQIPELEDRIVSQSHITPFLVSGNVATSSLSPGSHSPYQLHFEHRSRSTPPLRLSPDIFKVCASPGRTAYPGTQASSRPVSEASDSNRILYDFESDTEEDSSTRREGNNVSNTIVTSPKKSDDHFYSSECFMGLQLPALCHDSDDGDDEDAFYKNDDVLKNWGIASEPQTPRFRNSLSVRQRRYCSADNDNDSLLGACGGRDPRDDSISLSTNQSSDQRRHSFSDSSRGGQNVKRSYVRKAASGSAINNSHYTHGSIACRHSESAFIGNQNVRPGYSDFCDSRVGESENVFPFEPDNTDCYEDNEVSQSHPMDNRSLSLLRDRPSHHLGTQWRLSVRACLRLSSGHLLPWSSSIDRVSVSTQTPHMTSIMIRQILESTGLPNEARGTAAAHLRRRQSEGGMLLTSGSRPLPDIIPSGRDRAMSVPDLQTLARMQRAREVGRELRRLSDEFHFGMFLTTIHEEVDGQFPRISARFLRNPFSNVWTFLRQTFRRRRRPYNRVRDTSVDLAGGVASMHLTEHAEDVPGD